MSLLRRMRDMTAATFNEKLERSEDPVRMIDQYLASQREQIQQAERLHQQCVQHAQSLRVQFVGAEQWRDKREQQAMLALKAGEEQTARLALQDKMIHEQKCEQYRELYEQSKLALVELEDQLHALKADYTEIAAKRSYYQARLESVRLQRRMNEHMNEMGRSSTPRMFNRLEEKVSDLEYETRSLRDVRRLSKEVLYQAGSAVQQVLEQELNNLRKKLAMEGGSKL
ncbi:PspA/IM30 family protein [Paenibacillus psychroresistens]|uniref:PspA/IM30 family protein n=1 Tax=Paenibacillus psychroresistens TaxID=1778678 RepID=A0A6B8RGG9_9BACL|nr:PspA/IM30 family protein [Paenibacillus psychroresistens]QGQ94623.1 PspA/IM30 family protein [Paenibacillus psychroresistens]